MSSYTPPKELAPAEPVVRAISEKADEDEPDSAGPEPSPGDSDGYRKPLGSSQSLWGWLVVNLATGPTSAMLFTFLPATIQTVANAVGHVPGTDEPCAAVGLIECVVSFGSREVDYLTYFLYLNSISRGLQAVACILASGLADYSRFRKPMMMATIYVFAILSLPLAGLESQSYGTLNTLAALYVSSSVVMAVFMIIQASYIPMFMATAQQQAKPDSCQSEAGHDGLGLASWARGARASTWGIVVNNIGQIAAVLAGIIIAYTQDPGPDASFKSYRLAMTVSGVATFVIAVVGHFLLPNIPGTARPTNWSIALPHPIKSGWRLLRSVKSHPEVFKFCVGWMLFDASWFNFAPLLSALFLEVTGLNLSGGGVFAVYTLVGILAGCLGSLGWMYAFPRVRTPVKAWLYLLLGLNIFCVFWGCIGVSATTAVGLKQAPEFWVIQVVFMAANSAMLAYNRVVFASFIPKGSEALLSGLIFLLDLCTGWIMPLIQARIQDHTGDLHYSLLLSLGLMVASVPFFVWVKVDRGIAQAEKPLSGFA
ncbi:autophagy-related protein 22-like protein [Lasiosphaeris hirsuta]|uniref:Autophagy-related protein n=1 Tax=Lasiosphaeris hirsuta TaxID=260670 RepID=A0AA40AY21_9PEZI|nr:autophagy-related protein 22-like protein [Lasiosphaeris hirsuta]